MGARAATLAAPTGYFHCVLRKFSNPRRFFRADHNLAARFVLEFTFQNRHQARE